ncbi:MAG TPA: hypothetical protein VFO10_28145 [Oligoflexus sp.]|nr:hypothetical protein [Oligoflexus sp.]
MGTGNEPQRNPLGQPPQSQPGQKAGKGPGPHDEDPSRKGQAGKGTAPSHEVVQPDRSGKGTASNGK